MEIVGGVRMIFISIFNLEAFTPIKNRFFPEEKKINGENNEKTHRWIFSLCRQ